MIRVYIDKGDKSLSNKFIYIDDALEWLRNNIDNNTKNWSITSK